MTRLFYLHWNEEELNQRLEALKDLPVEIISHWSGLTTPEWGEKVPDIFVISLERLPSHGKEYASWLREAKKRKHIPLIFVDGKPEKVERIKAKFPDEIYCSGSRLPSAIRKVMEKRES